MFMSLGVTVCAQNNQENKTMKEVSKANIRHWNGATADKPLICITVTEHADEGHVVQLREVTDEEYNN